MSISTVETEWSDVWADTRITAYTTKVIKYEYTDDSEKEIGSLSYNKKVNFIEAVTERQVTGRYIGGGSDLAPQTYSVEIRYTKERDTSGDAFRNIALFFETLSTVVDDILGSTWGNTVSYYTEQSDPIRIENADIAGVKCWRAIYRFVGHIDGSI